MPAEEPTGSRRLACTVPDAEGSGASPLSETVRDAVPVPPRTVRVAGSGSDELQTPAPAASPSIPRTTPFLPDGPEAPRYQVGDLLGSGASSHVYAGRDLAFARPLAIKVLDAGLAGDDRRLRRFLREARICAGLEHPHIVPVYDIDRTPAGEVYLTMRRVSGQSLGEAIRRAAQGEAVPELEDRNRLVSIFIRVGEALTAAHAQGVVHRDVKPDNIMLGGFGEVMLVDWGAACELRPVAAPAGEGDDPSGRHRLAGTPAYMSPEQACCQAPAPRDDIYCLGASLFHALTRRFPTWGSSDGEFWQRKKAGQLDPPTAAERERAPPALLAIALKALAADPRQRYPDMAALVADLHAWQAGQAVSAWRDPWLLRLRRWHRRQAWRIWPVAAMLLVLVGAALLVWGERLKEFAAWGVPVFATDFADPAWQGSWATPVVPKAGTVTGRFTLRQGRLHGEGATGNHLFYRHPLPPAVAVEFSGRIDSGQPGGDLSVIFATAPPFQVGSDWTSGAWLLQVGAYDNSCALIQSPAGRVEMLPYRLQPGRDYRFRYEIEGERLRIAVDGRVILEHRAPIPLSRGWIGLYLYYPGKSLDWLRLQVRELPQRVAPTAIGDAFLAAGMPGEAADQYARLVLDHAGKDLGEEARFRQGLALLRAGSGTAAEAVWEGLADPDLRLRSRIQLLGLAFRAGRHQQALEAMEVLYRSQPAARTGLERLWIALVEEKLSDATLEAQLAFARRLGFASPPLRFAIAALLQRLGHHRELVDAFADQARPCALALIRLGRAGEILTRFPDEPRLRAMALEVEGRYAELVRDYPWTPDANMALIRMGRGDGILGAEARDTAGMLLTGRLEQLAALPPSERTWDRLWVRQALLLAQGQESEALALALAQTNNQDRRIFLPTLLRQDRLEEAFALVQERSLQPRAMLHLHRALLRRQAEDPAGAAADRARAGELLDNPDYPPIDLQLLLLPALYDHGWGGEGRLAAALEAIHRQHRWTDRQIPWHLAAYALGRCDAAAVRAQPCVIVAEGCLALGEALRDELAGRDARAAWGRYLALPYVQRLWAMADGVPTLDRFARWLSGREPPASAP